MNISKMRCYLVKEPSHVKQFSINTPPDVLPFLIEELHMDQSPVEQVYCLHLNSKMRITSYELISQGNQISADATPALILRGAILSNATGIILAHNHPSGDPTQSNQDIATTKQLIKASKLIGIPLLDHIIVGHNNSYVSLREEGIF